MTPEKTPVLVFISSPSDLMPERNVAEQVILRLDREFTYYLHVDAVRWERQPLTADRHFQDIHNIPQPRSTDIVVVVLWSRLGILLPPSEFRGAISGRPVTGTEWEFEDALAGARATGRPHLMLYHKMEPAPLSDPDLAEAERKLNEAWLVEAFIDRWFCAAEGKSFTAALHEFSSTAEFEERLYEHLRALLERRLQPQGSGAKVPPESPIRWHDRPFRGLAAFDIEHASMFFGRTRARHDLRERLTWRSEQGCAFVLVVGASGSGKSSLVKAGLLPDLMLPGMVGHVALVRYAALRPSDRSDNLFAALAAALIADSALPELLGLRYTPERLAKILHQTPEQVAFPIEQGLYQAAKAAQLTEIAQARLLLFVDQLEELFTLRDLGAEERERFVEALDALARSGLVWVITTIRADFFDRIDSVPALARLADAHARYLLPPPDDREIEEIIRLPAREAGLRFEIDARREVDLADTIRQAAVRDRGSLPLLSYLLDQLWQRRTPDRVLTFAAHSELGGLEGALGRRAQEVVALLSPEVQAALPRVLRALVTVRQGLRGTVTARPAALALFPEGSAPRLLVDALLHPTARLLIADVPPEGGAALVRVAHEALLTHWEDARLWIVERLSDLQLEEVLEAEAARWLAAPDTHKPSLLRRAGLPLTEAEDVLARRGDELSEAAIQYINASTAAEAARKSSEERSAVVNRITRRTLLGVLGLVSVVIIGSDVEFYLPLAEVQVNMSRTLLIAGSLGFVSTALGFEGTLLLAPILIFIGAPPSTAVVSSVYQMAGTSSAAALSAWRTNNLFFRLGFLLIIPGLAGSIVGMFLLIYLTANGYIELIIAIGYIMLLQTSSVLIMIENLLAIMRRRSDKTEDHGTKEGWARDVPSGLGKHVRWCAVSIVSGCLGIINALLGVGGDFILVRLLADTLRLSSVAAIGAAALRNSLVGATVTGAHAYYHFPVDIVLGTILVVGGMLGAQLGTLVGSRLRRPEVRILLALVLMGVAGKLAFDLTVAPANLYSTSEEGSWQGG